MFQLSIRCLFIYFALFFAASAFADVKSCIGELDKDSEKITSALDDNGYYYTGICRLETPFLHIAIVDLDNTKNEINITHSKNTDNEGFLLKRIRDHAESEGAHIAINGFTWVGATECPTDGNLLARILNEEQCALDKGWGVGKGYASNPSRTLYSKGKVIYQRADGNETSIGFAERDYNGTKAAFFDVINKKEVKDEFTNNLDSTGTTIIRNGRATNFENCDPVSLCDDATSSMGIGLREDRNVLVLLSSHGQKTANYGDHAKIFESLGVTDAIRLDGATATSLYIDNKPVNSLPLKVRAFTGGGATRKIMYALTVTEVDPIEAESKIDFENVSIKSVVNFGVSMNFSGKVTSEKPISNITFAVKKPDGGDEVDFEYFKDDISEIELSGFSFGTENFVDELGRYTITIIVEDNSGYQARKVLSVEVIPNITDMSVSPLVPFIEEPSYITVSGNKLTSDIRANIGTDQTPCDLTDQSDREATFSCVTYQAGSYPIKFRYRNALGDLFDLYDDRFSYVECNSGETETESCSFLANGENTKARTCSSKGIWNNYGVCTISCNDGYRRSGNICVVDTTSQVCTPDSTETKSCSITNGSGVNSRTCASDGESWGDYEGCKITSCDAGYVISGNSCVKEDPDETYEFFFTNARLDKTTVEAGKSVKASVTSNYSGNVRDGDMGSVNIGYYLSSDTKLDENDDPLGDDTSNLGSDDTSENESADLIIPSTKAGGEYYILFVINQDKKFPERDESNNVEFVKFEVTNESVDQYDFFIQNAKLNRTTADPGDEITASMDVHYSGNVLNKDMNSVESIYYLIAINTKGEIFYQKEMGTDTSSLGSDDTSDSESLKFNLPADIDPGKYYVSFVADYKDKFSETNENNNAEAIKIEVQGETGVPSIIGLEPSSPKVYKLGSFTRRTAYIAGANFETGASVRMCWSTGCSTLNVGFKDNASYSQVDSSSSIKIFFSPGNIPDNWNITVTNPDGETSNTFAFNTSD